MLMNHVDSTARVVALVLAVFLCLTGAASAQEGPAVSAEARANNPLANLTAFNVHNYDIGELTDLDDEDADQAWVRFAKPFSICDSLRIMRASLPFNHFPVASTLDHRALNTQFK